MDTLLTRCTVEAVPPAAHDGGHAGSGREWAAEEAAYGGHVQQALV